MTHSPTAGSITLLDIMLGIMGESLVQSLNFNGSFLLRTTGRASLHIPVLASFYNVSSVSISDPNG